MDLCKACDECNQRKIKCDGLNPCSTCILHSSSCHYSVRQRRGPKSGTKQKTKHSIPTSSVLIAPLDISTNNLSRSQNYLIPQSNSSLSLSIKQNPFLNVPVPQLIGDFPSPVEMKWFQIFLDEFNSFSPIIPEPVVSSILSSISSGHLATNLRAMIWGGVGLGGLILDDPLCTSRMNDYVAKTYNSMQGHFDSPTNETISSYLVLSALCLYAGDLNRADRLDCPRKLMRQFHIHVF